MPARETGRPPPITQPRLPGFDTGAPPQREPAMAYRIATLVGSLRRDSINRKFAHALARLAPADFEFQFPAIGDLPLYDQDHDKDPSPQVRRLKQQVRDAHGVVFVTPE